MKWTNPLKGTNYFTQLTQANSRKNIDNLNNIN